MHKPKIQQKTERRISAGLRLALVAVLLLAQIALVVLLSMVLRQRMAVAYTVLELLAIAVAVRIYMKPGRTTSYKLGWILLVLAVPVAGLILYFLWNGDRQQKRLDLKKKPSLDENEAVRGRSAASLEKLRRRCPQWGKLADYLCMQDFLLYQHTRVTYLPTGEVYLEDLLDKAEHAERFIFLEYYIMAEGQIWDRLTDIFRRKAAAGVEIKVIFDDFGSIMRMPPEQVDRLRQMGVQVIVFNPVHHYVNRLYFNYRDHRKIACVDGTVSYTGGANIADEYANLIRRFGYWKDCGVRLEGEGAWGLTKMFLELWAQLIRGGDGLLPSAAACRQRGLLPAAVRRAGQQPRQHRRGHVSAPDYLRKRVRLYHDAVSRHRRGNDARAVPGRRQRRGCAADDAGHPRPLVCLSGGPELFSGVDRPPCEDIYLHAGPYPRQDRDGGPRGGLRGLGKHGLPQLPAALRVRRAAVPHARH